MQAKTTCENKRYVTAFIDKSINYWTNQYLWAGSLIAAKQEFSAKAREYGCTLGKVMLDPLMMPSVISPTVAQGA